MIGETTDQDSGFLTRGELATLTAICDALLPSVEGVEPAAIFRSRGSALDVPRLVAEAIASLPDPAQRAQFKQLLGLFENRLVNLVLTGRFRRFSELPTEAREAYLHGWARSAFGVRRQGFQALKRLTCFLFYAAHPDGSNPAWPAIGYAGPASPPSRPREMRLTKISKDTTLEADVCVIGSGAGGAVVAAELAAAGHAVLVLEMGGYFDEADFANYELEGTRDLHMDAGLLTTRDGGLIMQAGCCLGGGTLINFAACFRPPERLLEEWERQHGVSGLRGPEFQTSVDAVEARLNVNDQESRPNPNNAALARGCEALGYPVSIMRRNVRGCKETGFCDHGCQEGAKQSTLVTYLADAQRRGAHFVVNCAAQRVLVDAGRVTGVDAVVTDAATGARHRVAVRAPAVVVAAGAIQTPAILMRSGLSHPALGRHLHVHPVAVVAGFYAEPIESWKGVPLSVYCDQFQDLDRGYGFKLETVPAPPAIAGLAVPWDSGLEHKRTMARLSRMGVVIALVRDRDGGRVTLGHGGRPVVSYWPSAYDAAHLIRGYDETARVLAAAGAEEVMTLHTPSLRWRAEEGEAGLRRLKDALTREGVRPNRLLLFGDHLTGTCRMGGDQSTHVVNPEGAVYGVRGLYVADGSVFPSASGENPMITIMSMAHRTAQFIKGRLAA